MHRKTDEIRMVAVDLDGTLLTDRKKVPKRTALALRALAGRGVKVVIALARPPRSVLPTYKLLGLDTWAINYNGALIWDEPAKKSVFHRPMPGKLVRQIIEMARGAYPDVLINCELSDRWYTDRLDSKHTTETGRLFKPDVIAPLKDFQDVSMTKVMLLGSPAMMDELAVGLDMSFENHCSVVRTDDDLLQIMDRRVSKGAALQIVADHYKIPARHILAIGDAHNDVDMLKLAGVAVAMDNAHEVVKEVADWIAPSNNDHGVHAALERFGLSN